jgi:hypothetical protein
LIRLRRLAAQLVEYRHRVDVSFGNPSRDDVLLGQQPQTPPALGTAP